MNRRAFFSSHAILAAVAVLVVIAFFALHGTYILGTLVLAGIYALVILGLVLLGGLGGQYSLGQAAFFGIGAYCAALLSRQGVPPIVGLLGAVLLTVVLAVIVGTPMMRLRGYQLAVGTLALGLVVISLLNGWRSLTLGPSGITGISPFSIGPLVVSGDDGNYWLVWSVLLAAVWAGINLWGSRAGQALLAVKRDEDAAAAMGIDVTRVKVQIFALSAGLAALGGVLYAHYVAFVSPDRFDLNGSFELLLGAMLGGIGTPFGAILGALLLVTLPALVAPLQDYKIMAYGLVFMLVALYFPGGIAGLIASLSEARKPV